MGLGRLLPSNLGAFLPEQSSPVLLALATSIDLFSIWAVVLLTLGMASAHRRLEAARRHRGRPALAGPDRLLRIAPAAALAAARGMARGA